MTDDDDGELPEIEEGQAVDEELPNAASRKQLRRRRLVKKVQDRDREAFWKAIFSTELGRREMWGLLSAAHAFETKFACGPNGFPQPEATWAALGEQQLGQRMFLTWQALDRDGVFLMLDENDPRFAKPKPKK